MFEVQDLRFATLATVSRCGMVWFSEDVLSLDMVFENFLSRLRNISIDESEEDVHSRLAKGISAGGKEELSPTMQVCVCVGGGGGGGGRVGGEWMYGCRCVSAQI